MVDVNGRALRIRARLPNADGTLRPGLFARLTVEGPTKQNVVVVPESAIVPRGTDSFVYRVENGDGGRGQGAARRAQGRFCRSAGRTGAGCRRDHGGTATAAQRRARRNRLVRSAVQGLTRWAVRILHSSAGVLDGPEPDPDAGRDRVLPAADRPRISQRRRAHRVGGDELSRRVRDDHREPGHAGSRRLDRRYRGHRRPGIGKPLGVEPHHGALPPRHRSRRGRQRRARSRQPRAPAAAGRNRGADHRQGRGRCPGDHVHRVPQRSHVAAADHRLHRPVRGRSAEEPDRRRRRHHLRRAALRDADLDRPRAAGGLRAHRPGHRKRAAIAERRVAVRAARKQGSRVHRPFPHRPCHPRAVRRHRREARARSSGQAQRGRPHRVGRAGRTPFEQLQRQPGHRRRHHQAGHRQSARRVERRRAPSCPRSTSRCRRA